MSDTLPSISLEGETWIEVYDESSIEPGTQITVQNTGVTDLYYSASPTKPLQNANNYRIFRRADVVNLNSGDLKVWVFSPQTAGKINVDFSAFNAPTPMPTNFNTEVAKGNVAGHRTRNILARNRDVGTEFCDVWDGGPGDLVYPTAGEQWEVVSDNAADTALGTGARTVLVAYLDDEYIEQIEVISLNGTTPVSMVATDAFRPQSFVVIAAGSTQYNEGNITLQQNFGAKLVRSRIIFEDGDVGLGLAHDVHYTVPLGLTLLTLKILPLFPKSVDGVVRIRLGLPNGVIIVPTEFPFYQSGLNIEIFAPGMIMEKTDIRIQAKVGTATSLLSLTLDVYEIDNNLLNKAT